jgi:hypothetical protein
LGFKVCFTQNLFLTHFDPKHIENI